ncbi:YciI family protein [Pseudonocardia sp. GCM10023141]|uniref:YciI family protein n=1 Tax=Pseudonocardia sp. GCM10023141 TaxID=3252653 RepID=UPI00360D598D
MPKFLLLTRYDPSLALPPMEEWDPAEITAHLDHLRALNRELSESGELIEVNILAAPELARTVTAGASNTTVVTDGPFPESKEMLAGYQLIDVESEARAVEIAALVSAAPGPGGVPIGQHIEVRQVMAIGGPDL